MEILESKAERTELETEWENMLAHQLPSLPPFEQFWQELPAFFEWLYLAVEKVARPSIPSLDMAVDETWSPPTMVQAWHTTTPLEAIRFAAANRLCVDLAYQGSHRLIEPYSLRRTRDGNLLLYAVKHNTGEDRAYRVDRIQSAKITKVSFTPRYAVELTTSGPILAPPIVRKSTGFDALKTVSTRSTRGRSRRKTSSYGPKYFFKCTLCGKQFIHKSHTASLNQHKNRQGFTCPGHTGFYLTTRY